MGMCDFVQCIFPSVRRIIFQFSTLVSFVLFVFLLLLFFLVLSHFFSLYISLSLYLSVSVCVCRLGLCWLNVVYISSKKCFYLFVCLFVCLIFIHSPIPSYVLWKVLFSDQIDTKSHWGHFRQCATLRLVAVLLPPVQPLRTVCGMSS